MRVHRYKLLMLCFFIVSIAFAQERTISGTVTDDQGIPLPGVNIVVSNTSSGTQTDFDGVYSIKANKGSVLTFSYIGFANVQKVVGDNETIDIVLEPSASELEEVVVTALGIERPARSLGYAVSTIKSDDLNEVRETNLLGALQGKTSGVVIQNQSGNVGGSTRILILPDLRHRPLNCGSGRTLPDLRHRPAELRQRPDPTDLRHRPAELRQWPDPTDLRHRPAQLRQPSNPP